MGTSPETKLTTVRLPAELYWRFKETLTKRRVNYQTGISQAIQLYIEGPAKPGTGARSGGEWEKRLERILSSGNGVAIETIQQQIVFFLDYIEHMESGRRRKNKRETA